MDFVPLRGEPERVRTRGAADVDDSSGKIGRTRAMISFVRSNSKRNGRPEPGLFGKPA